MITNKKRSLFLLLFTVLSLAGPALGQTTVYKYHSDGTFASVQFCNGSTCGSANLTRDGQGSDASASLFFQASSFDASQNLAVYFFGFGMIPPSDVQGSGTAELGMNLDFGAAPLFTLVACTSDPSTGSICNNVNSGTLTIKWHQTKLFTGHSTGTLIQQYPGVRYQMSGSSDNSSADAVGNFIGIDFATSNATIGVQHQASHSVQRLP